MSNGFTRDAASPEPRPGSRGCATVARRSSKISAKLARAPTPRTRDRAKP